MKLFPTPWSLPTILILTLTLLLFPKGTQAQNQAPESDPTTDAATLLSESTEQLPDSLMDMDPDFSADTLSLGPVSTLSSLMAMVPKVARLDSNFIRTPAGISTQMTRVVDKLDSILLFGKGNLSILHIGGSHVQADMYTEVFRQRIDSLNRNLRPARGVIFPFSVAKTNNPLGYRTRYGGRWDRTRCSVRKEYTNANAQRLGMMGIGVRTSDTSAWFSIDMNPLCPNDRMPRWTADRLTILGYSPYGTLTPLLVVDGRTLRPTPTAYGWQFDIKDSTGVSPSAFTVSIAPTHRGVLPKEGDMVCIGGLLPQMEDDVSSQGIVYHTIGVNGAAVPAYMRCADFEKELSLIRPDLVIMAIGVNDASGPHFSEDTFVNNYNDLIRSIRRVSPDCAFIFISNNDTKRRRSRRRRIVNTNGPKAQHAFQRLATEWQGGFWDLFEVMGGLGSMAKWQENKLAGRDNIHFSRAGYAIVGNLFYDAFINFYIQQDADTTSEH